MNKKLKELIEDIKYGIETGKDKETNIEIDGYCLSWKNCKIILEYITNLQKENENYKSRLEKQNESVHQRKPQTKNHHLVFSEFWNCKKSPTGYCVYDLDSDLGYDDCIFCHEPNERK